MVGVNEVVEVGLLGTAGVRCGFVCVCIECGDGCWVSLSTGVMSLLPWCEVE